jgi:hypothetical protein
LSCADSSSVNSRTGIEEWSMSSAKFMLLDH